MRLFKQSLNCKYKVSIFNNNQLSSQVSNINSKNAIIIMELILINLNMAIEKVLITRMMFVMFVTKLKTLYKLIIIKTNNSKSKLSCK